MANEWYIIFCRPDETDVIVSEDGQELYFDTEQEAETYAGILSMTECIEGVYDFKVRRSD